MCHYLSDKLMKSWQSEVAADLLLLPRGFLQSGCNNIYRKLRIFTLFQLVLDTQALLPRPAQETGLLASQAAPLVR